MTAFNWEYVRAHPIEFFGILFHFGFHAVIVTIKWLLMPWPTNYTTTIKSLLLRIFFRKNYRFIYSTPSSAIKTSRRIDGDDWWAYEVSASPDRALKTNDIILLYFHGGGFAIGEPLQYYETYKRWKTIAARKGVDLGIVALRYPLSTEKSYPAQKDAAMSAYAHLIRHEQVSPSRIIIAGDSAGGNLAASCLLYYRDHPEIPRPAGTIIISGWLDPSLQNTTTSPFSKVDFVYGDGTSHGTLDMAKLFAGEGRRITSPEISPALSSDLKGLPQHLCCYGTSEVYYEHSERWITQCKADGVDIISYAKEGAIHTFCLGGLTSDAETEAEADDVLLRYMMTQVNFESAAL